MRTTCKNNAVAVASRRIGGAVRPSSRGILALDQEGEYAKCGLTELAGGKRTSDLSSCVWAAVRRLCIGDLAADWLLDIEARRGESGETTNNFRG